MQQFKDSLISLGKQARERAAHCATEEATKQFLVLPFVAFLGYDDRNPREVVPEFGADFSEKYKNRVDYAIIKDGVPVIAIECKRTGADLKDERGQLRSYFNAAKTVKLAVLTDGLIYEFYADADEPNMMDQKAFLRINLEDASCGKVEDSAVQALYQLRKDEFRPENIGAEAKRKLIFNAILAEISAMSSSPSDDIVKLLLSNLGMRHLRQKTIDEYKPLVSSAFREVINLRILEKLEIEVPREQTVSSTSQPSDPEFKAEEKIVTTETEIDVYNYTKRVLKKAFRKTPLESEVEKVVHRDYVGRFVVYYDMERRGRLFNFTEGGREKYTFDFTAIKKKVSTSKLSDVDDMIIEVFRMRVAELREVEDSAPA